MKISPVVFSILACCSSPGIAAADALPPDLARAAERYDAAQVGNDRHALEELVANGYMLVNSAGEIETKAQFIGESTDPGFSLQPFVVEHAYHGIWANGAVLGGFSHLRGVDHGKSFDGCLRFADVWARRDGQWQVVFTEASHADPKHCAKEP